MKKKILYISGGRMDYGLMRQTLFAIDKHPKLNLEVLATGMHLMPEFGNTIKEIEKDKFNLHRIKVIYKQDSKPSMANFLGELIIQLTKKIQTIKPDIILLLGDRAEMLAGAIVGSYLSIPVAHSSGGDVTSTIDESARHSITKLSHLHFTASKLSAKRVLNLGEEKFRVFNVGAPGLDAILHQKLLSKKDLFKKFKLIQKKPLTLVVQHPVTLESAQAEKQIIQTMEAVKELNKQIGLQTIIIYPNSDAGGRKMIRIIKQYEKSPFVKICKSLNRNLYLSIMKNADVMLGNSSSGIVESAPFHLPAIDIGTRERKRERAENVINVDYRKTEIKKAVIKALYDKKFKEKVKKCKSPYGNGTAGIQIAKILANVKIDNKLLDKKLTY